MRGIVLASCILWLVQLHGQAADSSARFSLFTNATQNGDVSHPRANLGLDVSWPNSSVQMGFGVYYPNWDEGLFTSGGSAQLTYRARIKGKLWMDLQVGYAQLSYDAEGEYASISPEDSLTYFATHRFEKTLMDASAMLSFRFNARGRFWVQPFVGAGYRHKNTTIPGVPLFGEQQDVRHPHVSDYRDKLGNYGTAIVRAGVLIGLRFGK